jgi:hypothetical protein
MAKGAVACGFAHRLGARLSDPAGAHHFGRAARRRERQLLILSLAAFTHSRHRPPNFALTHNTALRAAVW